METPAIHTFLDGVTAGVVGLIAATALTGLLMGLIFATALLILYRWKAKAAVLVAVVAAGVVGLLQFR